MRRIVLSALALSVPLLGCKEAPRPLASRDRTFAELRVVRRGVGVVPPGEARREPFPHERLADGATVAIAEGGLAWIRRDGGATLLVAGPADVRVREGSIELSRGKAFIDATGSAVTDVSGPRGTLHLADVRAGLDVDAGGTARIYVLRGGVRTDAGASAGPGETLTLGADGTAKTTPELAWDDWTGGLATAEPAPRAAPYGVGTVGARTPGSEGTPRFSLAIQKLDVRVSIDGDLATTEVEEVFFNPTGETVEGLYRFRTPPLAALHRFGVDRDGELVWGRTKETQAAAAQYQTHVFVGSTDDPALLEWDAPGVYRARLYPIKPGGSRRVVTRYAEWLSRHGAKGERRLYTYPMAAEGAEGTLPRIEELTIKVDLAKAGATDVRSGMDGVHMGSQVVVRGWDLTPRADFSLELFDGGQAGATAYRAPHVVELDTVAPEQRDEAKKAAKGESDYVLVPVRAGRATEPSTGLDLAVVVDASAATDASALALSRQTLAAMLAHLGKDDRVAVWAGDAGLRAVAPGSDVLSAVDAARRDAIAAGLAKIERGGATDLGALVAAAAEKLDPKRRGAVVYVGDGRPTVGELRLGELRDRLDRLPRPVRLLTIGVGHEADMGILKGLARGGLSERVTDATGAAATALRVLEEAERPVWLGATVELGGGLSRVYPRDLGALSEGDTALVVARVTGDLPKTITVKGSGGESVLPLSTRGIVDDGDLRRRWAEGRLVQLLDEGAGRAAVVEVGTRYGVMTPFTSLYVPTRKELAEERRNARDEDEREAEQAVQPSADNKEGGTGTRAKGEEGSMGNPNTRETNKRYGVKGPADNADPHLARQAALRDAAEFGMIGLLNTGSGTGDPNAPDAPWGRDDATARPPSIAGAAASAVAASPPLERAKAAPVDALKKNATAQKDVEKAESKKPDASGFAGPTAPGGKSGERLHVGDAGGTTSPASNVAAPKASLSGGTDEAAGVAPGAPRVVALARGRVRSCYQTALAATPDMEGRVSYTMSLDPSGGVTNVAIAPSGSLSPAVVGCISGVLRGLSFGAPGTGSVSGWFSFVNAQKGDAPSAAAPALAPPRVGDAVRIAVRCGPGADAPLEDRVGLWRERLARATGNVDAVRRIYTDALASCEAPTWRERTRLLGLLLDALPQTASRVALWRAMGAGTTAGDLLYRSILARARTTQEIREMNAALGLRQMDAAELAKVVAGAKSADARVSALRELVAKWPDDHELALALLDAYEDAQDDASGRAFARKLRRLPTATARVRTGVGEYYLRLAKRPGGSPTDEAEARRTFGEIVEFSPDDPVARRRLGDLLRSHGWHADAFRQYETLARLVPDDTTVPLLLAAAAEGMGKVEEAIKWAEKAGASATPDGAGGTGRTARAFAAAFLAWAGDAARSGGRAEEADRLRERKKRLTATDAAPAGATRVLVTWSHPELHPSLWSNARGAQVPSELGDPMLGIAEVTLTNGRELSLRLDPRDVDRAARLGASVVVTAIFGEGTDAERIVKLPVTFGRGAPTRTFRVEGDTVKEAT